MLTKPDLKDEKIIACLHDNYGLDVAEISFLPLGADFNTAVYRRRDFGLTGGSHDSKDMQSLLSKISKIDNNTNPYHHLWRFDACCYRKSP